MHFYIGYTERQWSYVGIGALLLIAFPLLGIMRRLIIRRQFAKRPDKDMAIAWRISSETLQNSCALAQATLQWDALVEVVEAPEGFLLYPIPQMFHWLPKDGFASDDDRAAFVAIAREKARKYMVVR